MCCNQGRKDAHAQKLLGIINLHTLAQHGSNNLRENALLGSNKVLINKQILDREYLKSFSGYDSVICYGISFFKKKALVRKLIL